MLVFGAVSWARALQKRSCPRPMKALPWGEAFVLLALLMLLT